MEFTGKNKERFFDYLKENYIARYSMAGDLLVDVDGTYCDWNNLPLSMQFGVVQSYADSMDGCGIDVYSSDGSYSVIVQGIEAYCSFSVKGTRDEARLAAIKAFDEIVNAD